MMKRLLIILLLLPAFTFARKKLPFPIRYDAGVCNFLLPKYYFVPEKIIMTPSAGKIEHLTDAGSFYGAEGDDTLVIGSGTTENVQLGGLAGTQGHPIQVIVESNITIYQLELGQNVFVNFNFYRASGHNGTKRGLKITGGGRAIICNGYKLQWLELAYIFIDRTGDIPILLSHWRLNNGNPDSLNHHIFFTSIKIYGDGNTIDAVNLNNNDNTYMKGHWRYVTFQYCEFDSLNGGNVISAQHFFNGVVKYCRFTRTGLTDTRHVAGVHLGDGNLDSAYGNYFRHVYGDGFRFKAGTSLVAADGDPLTVARIFNNVFLDFTKYSPVEINSDTATYDLTSPLISPLNYEIRFNTAGNLTDSNYVAALVDRYKSHGYVIVTDNVVFTIKEALGHTADPIVNIGDGFPFPDTARNRYSATGVNFVDTTNGIPINNSPVLLIGQRSSYIPIGANGIARIPGRIDIGYYQKSKGEGYAPRQQGARIKNYQ